MNDAKPDVAGLPANVRELIGQLVSMAAITDADAARNVAERIDAARTPAGEGGSELLALADEMQRQHDDGRAPWIHPMDIRRVRKAATTEQPEGKGAAHFIVTVKDGDWTGTFEDWQTRCRARAPAAPGVRVDEAMVTTILDAGESGTWNGEFIGSLPAATAALIAALAPDGGERKDG